MKAVGWIVGGLFGLFAAVMIFGIGVGNTSAGKARAAKRAAIELCRSETARKSFDEVTKRVVAGECKKLEAELTALKQ